MPNGLSAGFAGTGGGVSVGTAHGSIVIDTTSLAQAANTARLMGRQIEQALGKIDAPTRRAQSSLLELGGAVNQLAGAFGVSLGVAGAVQLGRTAIAAAETATAYRRQEVAARSLAGSQAQLNDLLRTYERATGGAIDRATALGDVTRLLAVGFADTTQELDQFARAARGIAVATGQSQDYIISQLQLAIANQSTLRLDQLGLGVAEVEQRIDDLRSANRGLTQEMAYQQAILGLAEEKFGDLADSAAAQASGMEQLARSWRNFRLEAGKVSGGLLGPIAEGAGIFLEIQTARLRAWSRELDVYIRLLRQLGVAVPGFALTSTEREFVSSSAARDRGRHRIPGPVRRAVDTGPSFTADQTAAINEWAQERTAIEREVGRQINEAAADYGRQRAETIEEYQQLILRESQDYARQRQRQEQELARQIAEVQEEAAQQRVRMEAELARRVDQARADSAERVAGWEEDRQEAIAKVRADANERVLEMEEDFRRARERAERDHQDNLLGAAGRLDAFALQEEQRRFARQQQEAEEAHREQVSDTREAEQERIDELNKAHQERLRDEQRALDKQIRQAQEAHARQLADAAAADEERIRDMQEAFARQRAQEDEDRRIRLQRMAEDHQEQLQEMAEAHSLRVQQIQQHAADERQELEEAFLDRLDQLGLHNDDWLEVQEKGQAASLRSFEDWWEEIDRKFRDTPSGGGEVPQRAIPAFQSGGLMPTTGLAYLHRGEYVLNPQTTRALSDMLGSMNQQRLVGAVAGAGALGARSVAFNGDVHVSIAGSTNMGADEMYRVARSAFSDALEQLGYGA